VTQPSSAREANDRTASAVVTGNLAQVMADLTPEALGQMMSLGSAAGGLSPAQMPSIEGYDVQEMGSEGDAEIFHITFRSSVGTATLKAAWKQVMGQWKITAVSLVEAEAAPPQE
jgi:hypothetical protein